MFNDFLVAVQIAFIFSPISNGLPLPEKSMALRKSQRANCGVNPSVEMMVGVNDELERKAHRYLWVFYKKHDKQPFEIEFNSVRWPREYTTQMKWNMKPKEKVMLYFDAGWIKSSLCAITLKSEVKKVERCITAKVAAADNSLSDIS